MNEQNMDKIVYTFAKSAQQVKEQDLHKFQTAWKEPHRSSAPIKRRIICISLCILLLAGICVVAHLAHQPYQPLWDVEYTEFASFHAGTFNIPADETQTFYTCISEEKTTAGRLTNVMLPKLPCKDITAYWVHRLDKKNSAAGVIATLTPAAGPVSDLMVYYLRSDVEGNEEILQYFGFGNLTQTLRWQDRDISYTKTVTEQDQIQYKIYFEDGGQLCGADIYAPADSTLAELLNAIFV